MCLSDLIRDSVFLCYLRTRRTILHAWHAPSTLLPADAPNVLIRVRSPGSEVSSGLVTRRSHAHHCIGHHHCSAEADGDLQSGVRVT